MNVIHPDYTQIAYLFFKWKIDKATEKRQCLPLPNRGPMYSMNVATNCK